MAQKKNVKKAPKSWGFKIIFVVLILVLLASVGYAGYLYKDREQRGKSEKSVELSGLNLYVEQEFDYTDDYSYYLTYPKVDVSAFDNAVKDIVEQARSDFLSKTETSSKRPDDLNVSYDVNYYNDQFLSIDLFIYRVLDGKTTEREETLLFDRKDKKILAIDDLFKPDSDYLNVLSSLSRDKLKAKLGKAYNQTLVNKGTQPNNANFQEFKVNKKHHLVLLFEPGQVAAESEGIVTASLTDHELGDVAKQPYVGNLFVVAAAPQPPQQPERQPAATSNNGPVPQADPSGVNCATAKCIALTFDDGPSGATTPRLLDILKQNNVKATFFELGIQAQKFPSVTKRVVTEGHVIGNHTYDHKSLEKMSVTNARGEISRAADIIQQAGGVRPGLVRAPYGAITQALAKTLDAPFIQWNVDPDDWKDRDADIVYNRVISNAKPGAIVLSHDIYETTVDAYERIIPELIRQGYTLVTVPQLLGFGQNVAPAVYFSR